MAKAKFYTSGKEFHKIAREGLSPDFEGAAKRCWRVCDSHCPDTNWHHLQLLELLGELWRLHSGGGQEQIRSARKASSML